MEIFVDVDMDNEQITRQIDQMGMEEATEAVREAPYFLKVKSGPAAEVSRPVFRYMSTTCAYHTCTFV